MALKYTFRGGSHVREYKNTSACPITHMHAPAVVSIPLSQHIGAPARPTVAVGDRVLVGQVIGEIAQGLGCPVHASVSGKVVAIESRNNSFGIPVQRIRIENDGLDELYPDVRPFGKPLSETSPQEIVEIIRTAGISGMGGATFPTHAKLSGAIGKVDTVIINCAECEPFITANHRLMLEHPEDILGGIDVLLHALGLHDVTLAVEDNKMDAVEALRRAIAARTPVAQAVRATVAVMKTKYPQGDERQIVYALTGKEIPAGKLPADVGCIIFNAETCAAVNRAFYEGMPLRRRIVTVDGDCIANPGNVLAPIGTSYADLAAFCGGWIKTPAKIVNGGPMMGAAQWDVNDVVTKGTSAVLYLSEEFIRPTISNGEAAACIHCGRCAQHCPMHLMPLELAKFGREHALDDALRYDVMSCVECGTCTYNCPAGVEIVQYIRAAKGLLRARAAAEKAKAAQKASKGEGSHHG